MGNKFQSGESPAYKKYKILFYLLATKVPTGSKIVDPLTY
jgi:hypothetical protein